MAAERLAVQLGPIRQSVAIADLEEFADTGEIPPSLRLYSMFLSQDARLALNSGLQLDPKASDQLVRELLYSSAGERFLGLLEAIIVDSTRQELKDTFTLATQEPDGLSLLSFLRMYPGKTVTIDGPSAIALASQLNLPYWQSQALNSILDRELTVELTEPFEANQDPTVLGYHWVRQQTMVLRDYERDRVIPVDLYWSRNPQSPLIVISHGFGADRRFLNYLAHHLASHGFTVASLEHPGSNVTWLTEVASSVHRTGRVNDIMPATEFIERPRDISFLLDQLERRNRYSSAWQGKLNTNQVTVIGHSLGGYTALALAGAELDPVNLREFCLDLSTSGLSPADWLQCTAADLKQETINLRDERVTQVIALNPMVGRLFNAESLQQITVPVMLLTGTDDAIVPSVSQQLLPFNEIGSSTKYLITAIGGTHLSVGDPLNLNHALTDSLFMHERQNEETRLLRRLVSGVSLAFIMQMTPEAEDYAQFLTPEYVQLFSTDAISLRFSRELPPSLTKWLTMVALPMERLVASSLNKPGEEEPAPDASALSFASLIHRLPLVMFILPGHLPLLHNPAQDLSRRRRRRQR